MEKIPAKHRISFYRALEETISDENEIITKDTIAKEIKDNLFLYAKTDDDIK